MELVTLGMDGWKVNLDTAWIKLSSRVMLFQAEDLIHCCTTVHGPGRNTICDAMQQF